MEPKFLDFKSRLNEIVDLYMTTAVLGWDQETYMPPGGAQARGGGGRGAGVAGARGAAQSAGANNFLANGGMTGSNEILLDGIPITVCCQGQPALIPTIDTTEEFKVQTNAESAEVGRSGSGIIKSVCLKWVGVIRNSVQTRRNAACGVRRRNFSTADLLVSLFQGLFF